MYPYDASAKDELSNYHNTIRTCNYNKDIRRHCNDFIIGGSFYRESTYCICLFVSSIYARYSSLEAMTMLIYCVNLHATILHKI